jgi:hypothetical protein
MSKQRKNTPGNSTIAKQPRILSQAGGQFRQLAANLDADAPTSANLRPSKAGEKPGERLNGDFAQAGLWLMKARSAGGFAGDSLLTELVEARALTVKRLTDNGVRTAEDQGNVELYLSYTQRRPDLLGLRCGVGMRGAHEYKRQARVMDRLADEIEDVAHTTTEPPPPSDGATMSLDAKACAILVDHPTWREQQIADTIGCHVKHLPRLTRYSIAKAALKSGKADMTRGSKYPGKPIEAWKDGDENK